MAITARSSEQRLAVEFFRTPSLAWPASVAELGGVRPGGAERISTATMPSHPTLTYAIADAWAEPASQMVMGGLLAYNADFYGGVFKETKLAVYAHAQDGRPVAGLLGQTQHGWLYVGWLWVPEALRNQGIGTELMRRAETEALGRGCHHAHLTTLDFQACHFYERLGYAVFGALDDYPQPYKRFFMQKQLAALGSPGLRPQPKD